jgi:hypothetical protein
MAFSLRASADATPTDSIANPATSGLAKNFRFPEIAEQQVRKNGAAARPLRCTWKSQLHVMSDCYECGIVVANS